MDNASTRVDGISINFEDSPPLNSGILNYVQAKINEVSELLTAAEMSLQGRPVWSKSNQENEELFRSEILHPLLCQMGFRSVRVTHGSREEHGRDFVMEYETLFQELIYIGLQAKCGNINDRANNKIDEFLQQVNDAFEMTYPRHEPGRPHSEAFVSYMIVAISGEYTPNALKVIRDKMIKRGFIRGNVFFWDKAKIETLIAHYYKRNS